MRLVFANVVREPAFAWAAGELGWQAAGGPREYAQSHEREWLPRGTGASVTYVDDKLVEAQYLLVGGTQEEVASVRESVSALAPFYTKDSIRVMLDPAAGSYNPILGLYVAALTAPPEAEPEILSWFRDAMAHSNPVLRRAAYFATSYPGWREFEPMLVKAGEEDPDAEARDLAVKALASLRKHVWKEGRT
ncbi:MAG: hypothetical protein IT159_02280 [Bryobacterales bacterium]|nr:hypothetical protein [Bryobacterales bacterium]